MVDVYREEKKFEPVYIKLESQDEVNLLFALFNFVPVGDVITNCNKEFKSIVYRCLLGFKDDGYEKFHDAFDKKIICKF